MGKIIYITGGARSGKSTFAEEYVYKTQKERIYIATMACFDKEVEDRINRHKAQRGEDWITIEAHKDIAQYLENYKEKNYVILLDCITNLVNNLMFEKEIDWDTVAQEEVHRIEQEMTKQVTDLISYIKKSDFECVMVSNELGMGLVPPYPLGRYFRDICGRINQIIASEAESAFWLVSGLPLSLK